MNFSYETQGAITYLVCELEPMEQLDSLTLGMLTNNHIAGLAPVLYTEMNGQRFLKYNISAKITADRFFGGTITKQRLLQAFQNILNSICSADEYMIDMNCFTVKPEHIFLNVSNCETALICLPVVSYSDICADLKNVFENILSSLNLAPGEDSAFVTQLMGKLSNGAFNIYEFNNFVSSLQTSTPMHNAMNQYASSPVSVGAGVAPVSSFDNTISIDDMNNMAGYAGAPVPPAPQPVAPINPAPPVQPITPVQPAIPTHPPVGNYRPQPPVSPNVRPAVAPQPPQHPPVKPQVPNGPGFAIPGQTGPGFAIPGQSGHVNVPGAQQPAPKTEPQQDGEKKMSLFGLLSHYNKENAALYKAQKEEAKKNKAAAEPKPEKQKKQKKSKDAPANVPNNIPGQAPNGMVLSDNTVPSGRPGYPPVQPVVPNQQVNPYQRPAVQQPVQPATPNQQFNPYQQPAVQPTVQPVPVQTSFSETTVLSPAMSGETTVLSEPMMMGPVLTRVKSGEKISINKPVFRIGKEKSYVDYFIADNTAISRSHANIHTENGEYFIEDTNSTNHTYVNGTLITSNQKVKITSGDKIRLANEDFTFSI